MRINVKERPSESSPVFNCSPKTPKIHQSHNIHFQCLCDIYHCILNSNICSEMMLLFISSLHILQYNHILFNYI